MCQLNTGSFAEDAKPGYARLDTDPKCNTERRTEGRCREFLYNSIELTETESSLVHIALHRTPSPLL
jgi:hypothetical protein